MSSRPRPAADEGAQMMLLAAIVLLVAFLSLTALVARVAVVEQETGRDVSPTILREAEAVRRALAALGAAGELDAAHYADLEQLEGERGFLLSLECDEATDEVTAFLSDAQSALSFVHEATACSS